MHKTMKMKERVGTLWGWSFLGAIIGACVGAVLMKKALQVREERSFGTGRSDRALMGAERPGLVGEDFSERLGAPTGSRIPPVPPLDDVSTKIH